MMPARAHQPGPTIGRRTVMVDLRELQPGGINGGLQTYVEWLLPWLTHHHRDKFAFLGLSRSHNCELAASLLDSEDAVCVEADADMIWRAPGHKPAIVSTSLSPRSIAAKLHVDVLYSPLGALPFHEPGLHSVALIADMLHRELPEFLSAEIVDHRERQITPTVRNATMLQCISLSAQERLEHHYPDARGKTFLTYLPIQSRLDHMNVRAENAAIPPAPYFFYPANFWPHKNHRALITAFHRYVCEAGDRAWDLLLCGSDYDGNLLNARSLAESFGLEKKIHFPGYVDDQTLAGFWQQASALIFPSLHEGFGIPLLEAMAADLPILAANAYSLPEVAGNAAFFFDPSDPLEMAARMLDFTRDDGLRRELVQRGRSQLKKFDAAKEASHLVSALRGIPHQKNSS